MVRGLTLAVALALGTVTIPAYALGLGDIKAHSGLNQEFKADIDLLSVAQGELDSVHVNLATQEEFDKAGVQRPFYLTLLKFRPERLESGKAVVHVYSDFPIREPFLDFLVEINWPRGRLIREYTVLLDPPAVTKRRAPQVQTAPARTQTSRAAAMPQAAPQTAAQDEYGPVAANETLWSIAKKLRPEGASMAQMMIGLLRANPQAFIDGDINRLRKGQVLRVPESGDVLGITRGEANEAYREAQEQWLARKAERMQAAQSAEKEQQPAAGAEAAAAQLRIATARPQGEGEAGASEDRGDETVDGLRQKLLLARENAESSRVESESLRGEITDMQKRLDDMQRLLSLKDEQLARLQVGASAEGTQPGAEETAPAETDAVEQAMQEAEQAAAVPPLEGGAASEAEAPPPAMEEMTVTGELAVEQQAAEPQGQQEAEVATPAGQSAEPVEGEQAAPMVEPPAESLEAEPAAPMAEQPGAPEPTEVAPSAGEPEPMLSEPELYDALLGKNLPFVAGGAAVLVLLLILAIRRRKPDEQSQAPAAAGAALAAAPAAAEESDLLTPDTGVDAETDEATSIPSSSFPASDLNELHEESDEVDPVAEADVYIAYGRYQQAQDLLQDALKRDPERLTFKQKLLEVFYATRNRDAFNALAQGLVDVGQDVADPDGWARICDMGRDLDDENGLYARSVQAAAPVDTDIDAEGGSGLGDDELADLATDLVDESALGRGVLEDRLPEDKPDEPALDLDDLRELEDLEEELENESLSLDELESLDLDLPSLETDEVEETTAGTDDLTLDSLELPSMDEDTQQLMDSELGDDEDLEAQLEELSDLSSLDGDLGHLTEDLEEEGMVSEGESALDKPLSLDEAFETDLDSDVEGLDIDSLSTDAVSSDAVATKLDLAKAFVEMGDSDGARDILNEVTKEGNEEQRREAEALLGELA